MSDDADSRDRDEANAHEVADEDRRPIGAPGRPVRAIAFSSGGFNTAMHLGVAHALLVIQGKAPDAVAGTSAGAISAAALAEILQTGEDAEREPESTATSADEPGKLRKKRRRARIGRFREFLEAYLSAWTELTDALKPDTLQIEAERPLRPLTLPVHDEWERRYRQQELGSRHGFIRLYNDLLRTRLSLATITRAVRRYLGFRAADEIQSPRGRRYARGFELARTWSLVGGNLHRLTTLLRPLVFPLFATPDGRSTAGVTAATIIFAPRWLKSAIRRLTYALALLLLIVVWTTITVTVLGAPYLLMRGLSWSMNMVSPLSPALAAVALWMGTHSATLAIGLIGLLIATAAVVLYASGVWTKLTAFNQVGTSRLLREVAGEIATLVVLVASYVGVPLLLTWAYFRWLATPGTSSAWSRAWAVWDLWNGILGWSLLLTLLVAIVMAIRITRVRGSKGEYVRRLLARYGLARGLLSEHPFRQFFVRLFDPDYYGRRTMDDVVDRALRDDLAPTENRPTAKLLRDYEENANPPMAVGLVVADVETGELAVVPSTTRVVDGLLAATAVTPAFPPKPIRDRLFIDGANISSEPTRGLLDMLRERVHPDATVVHVYNATHLPFSAPTLRKEPLESDGERGDDAVPAEADGPSRGASDESGTAARSDGSDSTRSYLDLVEVIDQALLLQRFRDATLERRLTELITRTMPAGKAVLPLEDRKMIRAWVTPIEPEDPIELSDELARSETKEEKERLILRTVADGCRASMSVMVHGAVSDLVDDEHPARIPCAKAVHRYLKRPGVKWKLPIIANLESDRRPQPDEPSAQEAPGLPEVCRHCVLPAHRGEEKEPRGMMVEFLNWRRAGPVWPHESEAEAAPEDTGDRDPHFVRDVSSQEIETAYSLRLMKSAFTDPAEAARPQRWPRDRTDTAGEHRSGEKRPIVSLLFSGGVFRGVYQLGTLSGLNEAGVVPDVVAGASIGSITGAMVASAYAVPAGTERDARIARLAATYLAVDRLILTDRFADFIRTTTLRAAEIRFSLRQLDGFVRRYDAGAPGRFSRNSRLVMAGLERLFYLSPFELLELLKALRLRKSDAVYRQLKDYAQEWLDRMGVGNQILGSEPLLLLIMEHVLRPDATDLRPRATPFDRFLEDPGIYFLATTTNLTTGSLEVLGERQLEREGVHALLAEALLASSAFPGVFRPRWSTEVMPGTIERYQYIDGGVMDNLPLDAVARFLRMATDHELVARRPQVHGEDVPHLLFAASLEIRPPTPSREDLARYSEAWPALWKRSRQLRYNKKLEHYSETQTALRDIWRMRRMAERPAGAAQAWDPMDLEVVMVRPRWLCGTFAFHPMLGFRRRRQAESIAHGCATTLLQLRRVADMNESWLDGWGLDVADLPEHAPATDREPIAPGKATAGHCWFRPGALCPFGRERLEATGLPAATIEQLTRIHAACGRPETHASGH
jgi:predicted acylesterase/phospholipase RssA